MADPQQINKFVSTLWPYAKVLEKRTGIPAEYTIAMAANETGWDLNNPVLFGIKGKSPSGKSDTFGTYEVQNGQRQDIKDQFATYTGPKEAFAHLESEMTSDRYKDAPKSDPEAFASHIASKGWATDPDYAGKISSLARTVAGQTSGMSDTGGGGVAQTSWADHPDSEISDLYKKAEAFVARTGGATMPGWKYSLMYSTKKGGS
jgi:flagellar protein FlgJ